MFKTSVEALDTANPLEYGEKEKVNQLGLEFSLERIITEEPRPLYAVTFCDILPEYSTYFASVGGNAVKVYRILDDHSVEVIYGFLDEDVEEIFYFALGVPQQRVGLFAIYLISIQKTSHHSRSVLSSHIKNLELERFLQISM